MMRDQKRSKINLRDGNLVPAVRRKRCRRPAHSAAGNYIFKPTDSLQFRLVDDNMPYVALQAVVSAVGILTKDGGIAALGGRPLNLDFVFSMRQYARATTVCVGIRFCGTFIGWLSVAALVAGIRALVSLARKLPPWANVILLFGALTITLHPRLRARVLDLLRSTGAAVEVAWPELQRLMVLMQEKQQEADAAESRATLLLRG